MAEQVRRADHTDGEIDTLSARIAQIRTWTYVSNRPGGLPIRHTGKKRRGKSKIDCPTRYMKG